MPIILPKLYKFTKKQEVALTPIPQKAKKTALTRKNF